VAVIALEKSEIPHFLVPPPSPTPVVATEPAAIAANLEEPLPGHEAPVSATPGPLPAETPAPLAETVEPRPTEPQAEQPAPLAPPAPAALRDGQLLVQQREAAAREEAVRAEAVRVEQERQERARREAAEEEARRQEATRQEAARREVARREAERLEAERAAAEQQAEAARAAQRLEAARAEAARLEAERQEAARQAAAAAEARREEAARNDAARETVRAEAARLQAEQEEDARREARRRAMGRALEEEAARRQALAAARAANPLPLSLSTARRARLWGRADANAELVRYAEAWARKIHFNTPVDRVREVARRPHTQPMVTVAMRSDGSVESVTLVLSSGVPEIDEAIRGIVHSHAPFPSFPAELARDYDVVEIRRTWHFDTAIRLY
jgi:TolA protein